MRYAGWAFGGGRPVVSFVPYRGIVKLDWLGRSIPIVALLVATFTPLSGSAQVLRCDIATKHRCDASDGWLRVAVSVRIILDVKGQTVTRCDVGGCASYPAQFAVSGVFTNIAVPTGGMHAKMSNDGTTFVETATLADTVLVSFGACKAG